MLTLYADESGTDGYSPIVVVAGYVAKDDAWAAFQAEWKEFCDLNQIKHFHTTDFLARKKEFSGWSANRVKLGTRIVDKIISSHVDFGVVAATIVEDCEELFPLKPAEGQGRRKFSVEYATAATIVVNEVTKWALKQGYSEPIRFVFDRGPHGKGYVMRGIDRWRDMGHERSHLVGGHSFENKNDVPQLLAADWIVNHTWRISKDYLRDKTWNIKIHKRLHKLRVFSSCKIDKKFLMSTSSLSAVAEKFYEDNNN